MDKIHLSVIIPAYKEEKRIGKTLVAIDKYLTKQSYSYEILVINDGSKDKTVKVAKSYEQLVKNLKVIDSQPNHGKGYVVRLGMLKAQGNFRLFMDADNSTTIDHVEKMWPMFEKGADLVIGTRDEKDSPGAQQAVPQSFFKRMLGNMGNILIQVVAVRGIWDTQCGFKCLTAETAQSIFSKAKIDRFGFDIEVLALAKKLNLQIGIIPVYWINDINSTVSFKSYLKVFADLFKIKWNLVLKKYNLD